MSLTGVYSNENYKYIYVSTYFSKYIAKEEKQFQAEM